MKNKPIADQSIQLSKMENKFLPTWVYWVYGLLLFLPSLLIVIILRGLNTFIRLVFLIAILPALFLIIFTYKKKTNKLIDISVKLGIIPLVSVYIFGFVAFFSDDILKITLFPENYLVGLFLPAILLILLLIATIFLIIGLFKSKVSRV